jgi:hypothetical protein
MIFKGFKKYIDPESIFVYQMGKVGSSSLEMNIPKSIHIHNFYDNDPCWVNMRLHFPGYKLYVKYHAFYFIRRLFFWSRRKTKIITVVRDPHERNMSMYFQNLHSWLVHAYTGFPKGRSDVKAVLGRSEGVGVLYQVYDQVFPKRYPLDWFDFEFKKLTGINVYDYSFDKVQGYSRINTKKYEILILRADLIDKNINVVNEFCSLKLSDLKNSNDGSKKWYSTVYKEFKAGYKLSENDSLLYSESKYVKHFFDETV